MWKARGSDQGMCPGLRLFGVRTQDSGDGDGNPGQRAERSPHLPNSTCARPTHRPLGVNLSGRISFIKACRSYESRKERFWKHLRSNLKTPESRAFTPPFTTVNFARDYRFPTPSGKAGLQVSHVSITHDPRGLAATAMALWIAGSALTTSPFTSPWEQPAHA